MSSKRMSSFNTGPPMEIRTMFAVSPWIAVSGQALSSSAWPPSSESTAYASSRLQSE